MFRDRENSYLSMVGTLRFTTGSAQDSSCSAWRAQGTGTTGYDVKVIISRTDCDSFGSRNLNQNDYMHSTAGSTSFDNVTIDLRHQEDEKIMLGHNVCLLPTNHVAAEKGDRSSILFESDPECNPAI